MSNRRTEQGGVSRRTLMAGAVAAAASFTILRPELVRGTQANSKIELGVVGCGGRGAWIAGLFNGHGGYHIKGVADYFQPVADACGDALQVEKANRFSGLSGYKRLLDCKVDAIALETPPWFFPAHAEAAVAAGAHVYMAKPIATDVPGCLKIAELGKTSASRKRCFLVDFQMRTDPLIQQAVAGVHEGGLGAIPILNSCYNDDGFGDPPLTETIESRLRGLIWVNDNDLGGGYLVNAGIHAMDAALWIANKNPIAACGISAARRRDPHGDSHDSFSISYEYADGMVHNHRGEHVANLGGFVCGCQVMGQGAYMECSYNNDVTTWLRGGPKQFKGGKVEDLYAAGARRNIDTFHKNITGGVFDNGTVEPSVNSTLATLLGREACRTRTRITWDELLKSTRRAEVSLKGLKD